MKTRQAKKIMSCKSFIDFMTGNRNVYWYDKHLRYEDTCTDRSHCKDHRITKAIILTSKNR